jgi:hypothetical protein
MLQISTTSSRVACSTSNVKSLATKPSQVGAGALSVMSSMRASRSRHTSSPA